jgi:hypothetical protein
MAKGTKAEIGEIRKRKSGIFQKTAEGWKQIRQEVPEKQKEIIKNFLHQFKENKLHRGKSEKIVTDRKQAIAIALSQAQRYKEKVESLEKEAQEHAKNVLERAKKIKLIT